MNYSNPFFKKNSKVKIEDILKLLKVKNIKIKNCKINDIKELEMAKSDDITFLNSSKYINIANNTKSKIIITHYKYKDLIKKKYSIIIVDNVFLAVAKVTELFYPDSSDDTYDNAVSIINQKKFKNLKLGKNVLIGKNVKIGKNCFIGHNSIIESNVKIGNSCKIGSNVIIKKSIIADNVNILDGSIVGKRVLVFFLVKKLILDIHI